MQGERSYCPQKGPSSWNGTCNLPCCEVSCSLLAPHHIDANVLQGLMNSALGREPMCCFSCHPLTRPSNTDFSTKLSMKLQEESHGTSGKSELTELTERGCSALPTGQEVKYTPTQVQDPKQGVFSQRKTFLKGSLRLRLNSTVSRGDAGAAPAPRSLTVTTSETNEWLHPNFEK